MIALIGAFVNLIYTERNSSMFTTKIKRAVHIDFHTLPGIDDFGLSFSASDVAGKLKDAHVDYVNVCARCNIGFSYYPTKIGTPYPDMKTDLLGDLIDECHKRNIGVTAYLNGGLNHQALVDNPQFLSVKKDGTVYGADRVNDNYFRTPCYNSGYRRYLLDEIKEILEKEPDGIFCDCMKVNPCYCPVCVSKMKEQGFDVDNDEDVLKFAHSVLKDIIKDIRDVVPADKRLFFNGHPCDDIYDCLTHVELECLTTDSQWWGYDFIAASAPYYRNFEGDHIYMCGRFIKTWGDIGGIKSRTAIENDVYDALMYGYVPSVGDHMHPRFGLNDNLYKTVSEIYEFVASMEEWTQNATPVTEAAIVRNKITYNNYLKQISDSDKGAARMLSEFKICYDIVNEDMDLNKYKLIVLPDNILITETLKKKLDEYDGKILSTGKSISKSKTWDYIDEYTDDTNTDGFYSFNGDVYAQYSNGIKMKSSFGVCDYIEPYFNRHYDGIHGYAYIPYKECEGYCSVALKNNHAHIGFNVFEAYLKYGAAFHRELVGYVLEKLLPQRLVDSTNLPNSSRITMMEKENGTILHIKTTYPEHHGSIGVINEHSVSKDVEIILDGEFKNAVAIPCRRELETEAVNGKTKINIPRICGYQAIWLQK